MVQVAMLLCGIAAGKWSATVRRARLIILGVFLVLLVPQTISVASMPHQDIGPLYWLIQAVSLGVGLGVAQALIGRRERSHAAA